MKNRGLNQALRIECSPCCSTSGDKSPLHLDRSYSKHNVCYY